MVFRMSNPVNTPDSIDVALTVRDLGDRLGAIWTDVDVESPLEETLQHILRELVAIFPSVPEVSAAIYTYSEETRQLTNGFSTGPLAQYLQEHRPRAKGVTISVVESREPLFLSTTDVSAWPTNLPALSQHAKASGIGALANIPLVARTNGVDTVVGVLLINFTKGFEFDDPLRTALRIFGEVAATAIQNARLHQKHQQIAKEADNLRRKSENLSRRADTDFVLNELVADLETLGILGTIRIGNTGNIAFQVIEDGHRVQLGGKGFYNLDLPEWADVPIDKDPLFADMVLSRVPVIVEHTALHPILRDGHLNNISTWIAIPMVYGGDLVGIVTIDDSRPEALKDTEYNRSMLAAFGRYAARAIVTADVKDRDETRKRELEAIDNVTKEINGEVKTVEIIKTVLRAIGEETNCKSCTYFELVTESDGRCFVPVESWDHAEPGRVVSRRFRLDEPSLICKAYSSGQSQIYMNARLMDEFAQTRIKSQHPLSMMLVQVKSGQEVVGVICADHDELGWFTKQHLRFVSTLADQAGASILRSRRLESLRKLSGDIVAIQSLRTTLHSILRSAVELLEVTNGVLYMIDIENWTLQDTIEYPTEYCHPTPRISEREGFTYEMLSDGQTKIIAFLESELDAHPELRADFKSSIGIPILIDGEKSAAALWLNSKEQRVFTDVDIALLNILVNYARIGIRNARTYEYLSTNLDRRVNEFKEISQVAMRAAVLGELTHKIGNNASIIPLNVELIKESLALLPKSGMAATDSLDRINWAARQILQQVEELDTQEAVNDVSARDLLDDLAAEAKLGTTPNIDVHVAVEDDLPMIRCVRSYLRRALRNIVENAIASMPDGGDLRMSAARAVVDGQTDVIEFHVRDQGIGIPADAGNKVYELFYTTKTGLRNIGYGLWYSRQVAEHLGGSLFHQSHSDGTEFVLRIPVRA